MKRKREDDEEKAKKKMSPDVKDIIAVSSIILEKNGVSKNFYIKELSKYNYSIGRSTLNVWINNYNTTGHAVNETNNPRNAAKLSSEQTETLVGWVINQNKNYKDISLKDVVAFIFQTFMVEVTDRTALNYMNNNGLSIHRTQKKTDGFKVDPNQMVNLICTWLQEQNKSGFLKVDRAWLCSIDFTFTSHRNDVKKTFSPVGGAQPKSSSEIPTYTNCIITCLWANGEQTRCMLFTHNPKFNLKPANTPKKQKDLTYLLKRLQFYSIAPERVVYLNEENSTSTSKFYCAESPELLSLFFKYHGNVIGGNAISDNGNSFSEGLQQFGFAKYQQYPAAVHQYLSPNDNRFHAEGKIPWRNDKTINFKDDVDSSLALMWYFDKVPSKNIKGYFTKNFQIDNPEVTNEAAKSIMEKNKFMDHDWFQDCEEKYLMYIGKDARGKISQVPQGLESTMDGKYWRNK
jgi:transposase